VQRFGFYACGILDVRRCTAAPGVSETSVPRPANTSTERGAVLYNETPIATLLPHTSGLVGSDGRFKETRGRPTRRTLDHAD
jgi:hypothetical protein